MRIYALQFATLFVAKESKEGMDTGERRLQIESAGRPRVGRPKRAIAALRFGSAQPHVSGAEERVVDAIIYRKGVEQ